MLQDQIHQDYRYSKKRNKGFQLQIIIAYNAIMDIENISIVLDIYRSGSITRVARSRDLASSSVSRILVSVEEKLGVRLFDRNTRQIVATEEGVEFFKRMEPLVEGFHKAMDFTSERGENLNGTLRITAPVSFGKIHGMNIIQQFRNLHPGIELDLIFTDQRVDIVAERIDLAVRFGSLSESNFIAKKLVPLDYHVVATQKFLNEHETPIKPQDLKNFPCITFLIPGFSRSWKFKHRKKNQEIEVPIHTPLRISNALCIKDAAIRSMGIALLPEILISKELKNGKLISLFNDFAATATRFDNYIWLVYSSRTFLPTRTKKFIEFMSNHSFEI